MRLTEKELENILNRKGSGQEQQNKMRAVICDADGIKFPSKKHRNHYLLLKAMQFAGEIKFILREIPVSYTHLRAHETVLVLVCRLLLEKKKAKMP